MKPFFFYGLLFDWLPLNLYGFSSRWFEGSTLQTIKTTHIVPVELNSILYKLENNLEKLHVLIGTYTPSLPFPVFFPDAPFLQTHPDGGWI